MDNLDGLTVNVNQQTIQINAVNNNITVQTQPIYGVSTGTTVTKLSELENDVGFITKEQAEQILQVGEVTISFGRRYEQTSKMNYGRRV